MKWLSKFLNLDELIFDAVVVAFLWYLSRQLTHDGGSFINYLTPLTTLFLIYSIQFFLTWQLGKLYNRYSELKDSRSGRAMKKTAGFIVWMVLVFLLMSLPVNFEKFGLLPDPYMMWAFVGGVFAMMIGGAIGFHAQGTRFEFEISNLKSNNPVSTFLLLFTAPLSIFMLYLLLYFGIDRGQWGVGTLVFFGGMTAYAVASQWLSKQVSKAFKKPVVREIFIIFRNLTVPFIAATCFMLWQSINILGSIEFSVSETGAADMGFVFFNLILTGILPYRILLAIAPPNKPLNMLIGVSVLAWNILLIF